MNLLSRGGYRKLGLITLSSPRTFRRKDKMVQVKNLDIKAHGMPYILVTHDALDADATNDPVIEVHPC